MLESDYKTLLIQKLYTIYPSSIIMHLDPSEIQGIPDIIILYKNKWATLEGKKDSDAPFRPNQPYYIDLMNRMSFSRAIYPENEEQILRELMLFMSED